MAGARHAWILDAPRDLLLLIATPLLIVPLLGLARASFGDAAIAAAVLAFGATGHHLPGLLRAYGDRDLFERHRARFVFGPVLLFLVCFFFYTFRFEGLVAMGALWGTWHALAQVYGFGRIYDAKVGAFDARTAHLDKALCIVWFGLPLLVSPWRLRGVFEDSYASGLPIVSPETLAALHGVWIAATAGVSVLWLANQAARLARGDPANPMKVALFVSSIAVWYYAIATASHAIIGLALFEIFHDVQYLTIVWLYNRKRCEQPGAQLAPWLRYLFRPGIALLVLYVIGVFAYGGLDFVRHRLPTGELTAVLSAFFAMSAFLHYYFDSFIWNLRDASTRRGLAVSGDAPLAAARLPAWVPQLGNWAWFGVPLLVLVTGQLVAPRDAIERRQGVVASMPQSAVAWVSLAEAQRELGRHADGIASVQRGLALDASDPRAWTLLAELAHELDRPPLERHALEQLIALEPDSAGPRLRLALNLERAGESARAREEVERARRVDPLGTAELLPALQRAVADAYRQDG